VNADLAQVQPCKTEFYLSIMEAVVLRACMELYYDLRPLRLVTPELLKLRQLAWIISVGPLLRGRADLLTKDSFTSSQSECHRRSASKHVEKLLSARSKEEFIRFLTGVGDTTAVLPVELEGSSLCSFAVADIPRLINAAVQLKCCDTASHRALSVLSSKLTEALKLSRGDDDRQLCVAFEALQALSYWLPGLKGCYAWARVRSLLNCKARQRVATENRDLLDEPLDELNKLYCWCRGRDSGDPMIQCDDCSEWFHCACVGFKSSKGKRNKKMLAVEASVDKLEAPNHVVQERGSGGTGAVKNEPGSDYFYCIACCNERQIQYPYEKHFASVPGP
jgi:hypothetical protein